MAGKRPWESKTLWLNAVVAVVALVQNVVPGIHAWLADPGHMATVGLVWAGLGTVVRLLTKDRVVLRD